MGRLCVNFLQMSVCAVLAVPAVAQRTAAQMEQDDAEAQKLNAMLAFVRNRNTRDYAITTPNGIDEARYIQIDGIEQWITIRGEDRNNPVLLFLHGGPGDATNPWGYAGFRSWLKKFTVVQWDQRGAGRTLGNNGPSLTPTITIERMAQDGIELAETLCKELRTDKIILVGHSWGSILGIFMVKARPDLFHAFVGTGQIADPARNYVVAYDKLVKKAESRREERAIQELKEVGPPPYPDGRGYAVQRKWSNLFEGADSFISSMLGFALSAPGYTMRDVNDWLAGQSLSAARLIPQTSTLDAKRLGGEFAVPVFVIQCRGFHYADEPRQKFREFDPCAAQGVCRYRGRRAFRRVHEVGGLSERARRASAPAGDAHRRPLYVSATRRRFHHRRHFWRDSISSREEADSPESGGSPRIQFILERRA
jgi:pimeloyl-ACP methyl ester carboxylesterase